jgi:uncharacterized protein HemY
MGFESESAALKEDNKARLIIEKALKKNLDQNLIVLMKQLF